ncbi:hypothetical protein JOM56_012461 [Amanita muscaria]
MRFFVALVSVLSIAGLALGAPVKETVVNAMQEGKVPKIKPAAWGSKKQPGNQMPHPAAVISNNGGVASVAQLTHRPIAGQRVIETGHIAPSIDKPDAHGRKSYVDLNAQHVNTHNLPKGKMSVIGKLPQHEHDGLKVAVNTVPLKLNAGKHAAAAGQYKTNSRTAAQDAAAAGLHKSNLRGAAHAAASAAQARNARLGHRF